LAPEIVRLLGEGLSKSCFLRLLLQLADRGWGADAEIEHFEVLTVEITVGQ
jgi:hypothetical protein